MNAGIISSSKNKLVTRFRAYKDSDGDFRLEDANGNDDWACKRAVRDIVRPNLYRKLVKLDEFFVDLTITVGNLPGDYTLIGRLDKWGFDVDLPDLSWSPCFRDIARWAMKNKHVNSDAYFLFEIL